MGGLHDRAADTLLLDQRKAALGLVDGETYTMDMFYAERNPVGANFMIKTSMDLRNSDELYYKDTVLPDGSFQYDIWQRVLTEGVGCGMTRLLDEEALAQVNFYLEGPQFPDDSLVTLSPGKYFGGLTIDPSKSRVTVDSSKITGLAPGEYRVTFESTTNKDRTGYLVFTVSPRPHHLDILTDSISLDLKQDALIDSILIDLETDSIQLYAVVRDSTGNYIQPAVLAVWLSRDEDILSVHSLSGDLSRCVVVKKDGGTTWIVVNSDGLKPDSVRIVAVARPKYPIISSAVMLDDNGDIIPDLIKITLSDTFAAGQTLTSVEISYKGNLYSIPSVSYSIDQQTIYAPFTSLTGVDGTPSGDVKIIMDVDGDQESHTKQFSDGVGPSIISADVMENDGPDPDILFLTFSEPVFPATLKGGQLLLIKAGTTDTFTLSILQVNYIENDSTMTVLLSPSADKPVAGDKLRLVPGIRGGKISELNEIKPHDLNIAVTIGFRAGAATIKSAFYKDTDGDGVIDSVIIGFRRAVQISEFDTIRIQWNSQPFKIDPGSIGRVNDSSLAISVRGTVINTKQVQTSGLMYISVSYKSVPGVAKSSMVADSAAPVLVSATLYPGKYNKSGPRDPDTLNTLFSEDIQTPGEYPFSLNTPQMTFYRFKLSITGGSYNFLVTAIDPDSISPRTGDSIWIDVSSGVGDSLKNIQLNPLNRRVLLQVKEPDPEWVVRIGPNPVNISESVSRIRLMPGIPITISRFRAKVIIYDALGNQIQNTDMKYESSYFEYVWDGRNRHGRKVGMGIYSVMTTLYDGNSVVWRDRTGIGVRR